MRNRRRFQMNVESLEGKALLSTVPILSSSMVSQVLRLVDRAAGSFAKTHNENVFVSTLSQISTKLPYGHGDLFPTWQSDVSIYDPTVPGSGTAMVKQLKADLNDYVQSDAADGLVRLRGFGFDPPVRSRTAAVPVLSTSIYQKEFQLIDRAAGTLAKTHNENAFIATLSQISTKIPFGHSQLFPTWQSDVGIYDPTVPGSGTAMVKQLKSDLTDYVQSAVSDASIRLR
jgi:hypothetical protein